jgi:hypothetical protein
MVLTVEDEDFVLVAEVALVMVLGAELTELDAELAVEVWVVEKEVE